MFIFGRGIVRHYWVNWPLYVGFGPVVNLAMIFILAVTAPHSWYIPYHQPGVSTVDTVMIVMSAPFFALYWVTVTVSIFRGDQTP